VIDPDHSIEKLEPMVRRLIRESVVLKVSTNAGNSTVRIDAGQFEQVVMNLILNASDAMPRGGDLTLATDRVHLDDGWTAVHPETHPGAYVVLEVSDSGEGIDASDLERIFDPFFTTKGVGHGTGLGLASAHGIITQAGGAITVDSARGRGTTFRVFLPEASAPAAVPVERADVGEHGDGLGTLLLCEDDPAVRQVTHRALARAGYRVLPVESGERALELLRADETHIDLLISDVIMPGMNGAELASRVTALRPGIRVLLVSGYTSNVLEASGMPPDVELLEKPFTPAALLSRVAALVQGA